MKKIKVLTHFIQSSIKTKLVFAVIGIAIVSIGAITYSKNGSNNSESIGKDNILVSSKVKIKDNTNSLNNISADDKGGEIKEEEKTSSPLNLEAPATSPVVNTPVVKATTSVETLSDIREQVIEKHTGVANTPVIVKAPVKAPVVAKTPVKVPVVTKAPVEAPVVKAIASGFKDSMLNEFYVAFHETPSTFNNYFGVKRSVFKGYLKAVASGQMSKSTAVSKIKSIGEWEENIALPYQTEKKNRTIYASTSFDSHHVIVYETTETNGGKIAGYMFQHGLLTTGDYYECSIYYDASIKKYRIALIGIPLLYKTRID